MYVALLVEEELRLVLGAQKPPTTTPDETVDLEHRTDRHRSSVSKRPMAAGVTELMTGNKLPTPGGCRRPSPIGGDDIGGGGHVLVDEMSGHVLARILASHPHFCDWGAQQIVLCMWYGDRSVTQGCTLMDLDQPRPSTHHPNQGQEGCGCGWG